MHLRYLYVCMYLYYTYIYIFREIIGKVEEPSSHFLNEAAGELVIGAKKKNKNMCIFIYWDDDDEVCVLCGEKFSSRSLFLSVLLSTHGKFCLVTLWVVIW